MMEKMKYYNLGMGAGRPSREMVEPPERIEIISYLQEEELMDQELGSRWYNNSMRDEYAPKIGTRL